VEALRCGPFINNSLIAVIEITEDGRIFFADDDFDTGSGSEGKKNLTIKCTKICYLNCFNVGNWTAVPGSLLFTVKMPFRHETTWQLPSRGEKNRKKNRLRNINCIATDWKKRSCVHLSCAVKDLAPHYFMSFISIIKLK